MADIRPFRAIRPDLPYVSETAALPYDVYNREEARKAIENRPLSFLNIDRPETQFPPETDMYADFVYQKAHELLEKEIKDGIYVQDTEACYYMYALTMNGRTQTGFVGCASIDDYANGIIKKHENTRAEKEADRIRHVTICEAQTGPIFLAYRNTEALSAIAAQVTAGEPLYDFTTEDGIRHTVWKISEKGLVASLSKAFQALPAAYIADGHHRAASAVKAGFAKRKADPSYTGKEEYNFFLSVLFPDDELFIMPYNRVVKDLAGLSSEEFLSRVSESFIIEEKGHEAFSPMKKGSFGMLLDGSWYALTAKPSVLSTDPVKGLDVSVLQDALLDPVLKIKDPRTDSRIDFVGGIRGIGELERRCQLDMRLAFSMYPTSIGELFAVADAGLLMPPKSTWFEPKLRSGIFIHKI